MNMYYRHFYYDWCMRIRYALTATLVLLTLLTLVLFGSLYINSSRHVSSDMTIVEQMLVAWMYMYLLSFLLIAIVMSLILTTADLKKKKFRKVTKKVVGVAGLLLITAVAMYPIVS